MIGKSVSHYTILEKLGEGGMGVVYKALDTKLDRTVALKFLPHYAAGREADKQRFIHEARAVAALMHQNIAVIHEIDDHEGLLFLVLEYVDGGTLKTLARQESGHMSIKEVIDIILQVCEGLGAAHEKGIVHRDIKSENIMLTSKGGVKIMDFGLAKFKGATKVTRTGSTVGTVAYMSPEQARGEEVDLRSDIFSLGVVLYEMVSGKLPFKGEHEAAMIYSLVNEEPALLTHPGEEISTEFRQIVSQALAKDREARYQSVNELVADLRVERKRLEYMSAGSAMPSVPGPAFPHLRRRSREKKLSRNKILLALLAVSVLGIALIYFFGLQKTKLVELNPAMAFHELPTPFKHIGSYSLSADGNWSTFSAMDPTGNWNIYFMNISIGIPNRIVSCANLGGVEISPDGSMVAYGMYNPGSKKSEILLVSTQGGTSKKIVEGGFLTVWSPDGSRIGYGQSKDENTRSTSGNFEGWSVRIDGRDNRRELIDTSSDGPAFFCWSPDGKSIAWSRQMRGKDYWEISRRDLETGKEFQLTTDQAYYTGQGGIYWGKNDMIIHSSWRSGTGNLWAVPSTGGVPLRITNGVGADQAGEISDDCKKILYEQQTIRHTIWVARLDGTGARQITSGDYYLNNPSYSPDKNSLVFNEWSIRGYSICVIDRNGTNKRELSTTEDIIDSPKFSPDGKRISFISRKAIEPADSNRMYFIETANPSIPKLVGRASAYYWFSPESIILYRDKKSFLTSLNGTSIRQIGEDSVMTVPILKQQYFLCGDFRYPRAWIVPAPDSDARPKTVNFLRPLQGLRLRALGPDGSFVLFVNESGELWKITLPGGTEERVPGKFPGLTRDYPPFISYDGEEIAYIEHVVEEKLLMVENPFK